ncbi:MAG TPA: hypothetical protein VI112_16295 [Bacteroidia bacterium]|jgi:UPF0716 family protein affecting phage T7 exclusion
MIIFKSVLILIVLIYCGVGIFNFYNPTVEKNACNVSMSGLRVVRGVVCVIAAILLFVPNV